MLEISFNNLSKADGSALIEQDNTIIQAAVFGPVDVAQSKINYEEAIVEISYKPKVSIPVNSPLFEQIRELENLLRKVFKEVILTRLFPRTSIIILVQEIYNHGSLFGACINAASCALIDAGVPMKCPVVGVTIDNMKNELCSYDFVFDKDLDIITIMTRGVIQDETLKKAVAYGQEEAKNRLEAIRVRIKDRFTS